jgi:hypothetical protein
MSKYRAPKRFTRTSRKNITIDNFVVYSSPKSMGETVAHYVGQMHRDVKKEEEVFAVLITIDVIYVEKEQNKEQ